MPFCYLLFHFEQMVLVYIDKYNVWFFPFLLLIILFLDYFRLQCSWSGDICVTGFLKDYKLVGSTPLGLGSLVNYLSHASAPYKWIA